MPRRRRPVAAAAGLMRFVPLTRLSFQLVRACIQHWSAAFPEADGAALMGLVLGITGDARGGPAVGFRSRRQRSKRSRAASHMSKGDLGAHALPGNGGLAVPRDGAGPGEDTGRFNPPCDGRDGEGVGQCDIGPWSPRLWARLVPQSEHPAKPARVGPAPQSSRQKFSHKNAILEHSNKPTIDET